MAKTDWYVLNDFKGGLYLSLDEELIPRNASPLAQNVRIADGTLRTAAGYQKYIGAPVPDVSGNPASIGSLMKFYRNGGDTRYLLAAAGGRVLYWDPSGGVGGAWTEIGGGFTSDVFDFLNYQNDSAEMVILGNGVEAVQKWSGPSPGGTFLEALGGDPPRMKSMALHYERLWCIGDSANPNRAAYSNKMNPEDWDESDEDKAGHIEVLTWDGGVLLGLSNIFDDVVLYKTHNMFRVIGTYPGEYELRQVFTTRSAIAERSIVSEGTLAFHLCHDGIYVYDGTQARLLGGERIKPYFNTLNRAALPGACAEVHNDKLYVAVPEGASAVNNAVIEYDILNDSFLLRRGMEITQFLEYDGRLLFSAPNGYIYAFDEGVSQDGRDIEAVYETPWEDLGRRDLLKTVREFYAVAEGTGRLLVTLITDTMRRRYLLNLPRRAEVVRLPVYAEGRRFKLRFENVAGGSFMLARPQLKYQAR